MKKNLNYHDKIKMYVAIHTIFRGISILKENSFDDHWNEEEKEIINDLYFQKNKVSDWNEFLKTDCWSDFILHIKKVKNIFSSRNRGKILRVFSSAYPKSRKKRVKTIKRKKPVEKVPGIYRSSLFGNIKVHIKVLAYYVA